MTSLPGNAVADSSASVAIKRVPARARSEAIASSQIQTTIPVRLPEQGLPLLSLWAIELVVLLRAELLYIYCVLHSQTLLLRRGLELLTTT